MPQLRVQTSSICARPTSQFLRLSSSQSDLLCRHLKLSQAQRLKRLVVVLMRPTRKGFKGFLSFFPSRNKPTQLHILNFPCFPIFSLRNRIGFCFFYLQETKPDSGISHFPISFLFSLGCSDQACTQRALAQKRAAAAMGSCREKGKRITKEFYYYTLLGRQRRRRIARG